MIAFDRIRAEQIKSIYRNTAPGMVATFIAVSVLTAGLVYIDAAVRSKAAIFAIVMFVQTAARLFLYRAYSRVAVGVHDWRPWALWFTVGTLVGGMTIGVGSIWMMSPERTDLQLIALLLIFAVTSGAVSAFGAYLTAFYVFFVSISIAPAVWLFMQGDVLHATIGGVYILWFVAIAEQARRSSIAFIDTVQLRFENQDLVEGLRREKAIAEEANAAKSRFLAAASHDLRQPVHALSLFVEAMRPRTMDGEARGLLDHIDGSVRAMGGLFGGLLDISRLDAGVVEVDKSPFPIQPLLERVCRDYEAQAREKGVQLRLHKCSAWVNSDAVLLERIVRNVIANAVAYTGSGRVVVGCRRGKQLAIQVWDTGRGIPEAEQQHIFQEFYQLDNTERDRTKGVGLGLAIVKRLTTLLDHPLRLVSRLGKGSMFSVVVPMGVNQSMAGLIVAESETGVHRQGSGLILVVDDEVAIQVAMKSLLQSWGYEAVMAASCNEMLKQIAAHREVPKLIICDYRLREEENGIAVIERLRSEYNDDIPGMLVTGDTAPDRLKEAQDSGFLLLHKPVPNSKLRAAITHLIDAAAERDAQ